MKLSIFSLALCVLAFSTSPAKADDQTSNRSIAPQPSNASDAPDSRFCNILSNTVINIDQFAMASETSAFDAANMSAESLAQDHNAVRGKSFERIDQDVSDSNNSFSKGMPMYGALLAFSSTQNLSAYQAKITSATAQFYLTIMAAAHKMSLDSSDLARAIRSRNTANNSAAVDSARATESAPTSTSTYGSASCYGSSCNFQSTTTQNTGGFWGALHRANTRNAASRVSGETSNAQIADQEVTTLRDSLRQQISDSAQIPFLVPVLHAKWLAVCPSIKFNDPSSTDARAQP